MTEIPTLPAPAAGVGERILGADGPVARAMPGYEARPAQMRLATVCESAIRDERHLTAEAGTGTGKSAAYLVAAILSGKQVVVTTDTIQLQQQLVEKDLPLLLGVLPRRVKFALAKGRGNYFCERNTRSALEDGAFVSEESMHLARAALTAFTGGGWDGDRSNLRLPITSNDWPDLGADDSCTGRSCPYALGCPLMKARQKLAEADIVVANSHLYLLHHQISEKTGGAVQLLPAHAVWIGDEAHTLADKVADVFGVEISQFRPQQFATRVLRQAAALDIVLDDFNPEAVKRASAEFFAVFLGAAKEQQALADFPPQVLTLARERMSGLVEALEPARTGLHWEIRHEREQDPRDEERLRALQMLLRGTNDLIDTLHQVFPAPGKEPPAGWVTYVEITEGRRGGSVVTLHHKPADSRSIMERIVGRLRTVIFVSATLATGYGPSAFATAQDELGLPPQTLTLQADSPFDYARQVRGYVPHRAPDPQDPEYHTAMAREVTRILEHTQGRAFVLFTARRDMRAVYALVESRVRFPVFLQDDFASKDLLIERFRATPHSVLFGVRSFWTGVDIAGEALSCVILTRLPFPVREHPLVKARCQNITDRGGSDFREYSLPRCIRDVRQGFGRLIRTQSDRGLFAILDPRLRTKGYGRDIVRALPSFPIVGQLQELP